MLTPHVNLVTEFVNIGGNTSTESYLVVKKLLRQLKIQMQIAHPGYGFLSENVTFRDEINKIEKIFIGPPIKQFH